MGSCEKTSIAFLLLVFAILAKCSQAAPLVKNESQTESSSELFSWTTRPFSTSDSANTVCGKPWYRQKGIIGARRNAKPFQWPWQVLVLGRGNATSGSTICGGSLLSKQWVITASHCIYEDNNFWGTWKNKVPTENLLVAMGGINSESENWVMSKVLRVVEHPRLNFKYDIALLQLETPLQQYSPNILPICLPERNASFEDAFAVSSGWGRLDETDPKSIPDALQFAELPITPNKKCGRPFEFHPHWICAGYPKGGKGICYGESGGPLVVRKEGRWVLAGVASWVPGCAKPIYHGVYTRVTEFLDWIESVTGPLD